MGAMTIDLKLALFLLLLLIMVVVLITWVVARKRPFFSPEQFQIWHTAPFGILILTQANKVQFVNKKAQTYLGVGGETAVSQSTTFQHLLKHLQTNSISQQFSLNLSPEERFEIWRGDFGTSQLIIMQDSGEEKRREMELQLFWGGVSHELRTPMTSILSHLEIARSKTISEELKDTSLEVIYQQAQRLTNLVQKTLALGRLKTSPPVDKLSVDIILVAEEVIASLILLAEQAGQQMSLSCQDTNLHVYGNPHQLKQLFTNLLDNAMKYTTAGDAIYVNLSRQADVVHCEIKDTGRGIPAEHLPHITEQFYRGQREQIGNGLGLALVKTIIDQHDGHLQINSVTEGDGMGTAVCFTLPIAPNQPIEKP